MSSPIIYLITGANRGIGLALTKELVRKHQNVVILAGVRDPASAKDLISLASSYPGKVEIVKFISGDVNGNNDLAKAIKDRHGYVDVVIACAAISEYMGTALETPPDQIRSHLEVNVTGVLVLFQATSDLLKESKNSPKFIPISSAAASLTAFISLPAGYTAYGASKAAMNYIARKIHFENEWITCFPLAPGIVATDMAISNRAMDKTGTLAPLQDAIQISPAEAAQSLLNIIKNSTREKDGGEFLNVDGTKIPW